MDAVATSQPDPGARTLIDALLEAQRGVAAVERFSAWHSEAGHAPTGRYRHLMPARSPRPGEQYCFEVQLDLCSGCKACVTACHARNGLEEDEAWRSVGLLVRSAPGAGSRPRGTGPATVPPALQHVTTACHHCLEPACLKGCPVLAYDKDPQTGIVRHLDDQCIGCTYCVLMCPYEVPRYSPRLGIVRKCDLCSQRLAAGEPPACAQACPSGAITLSLVDRESLTERYATACEEEAVGRFLPDAPDPRLTLPATRFKFSTNLHSLAAADAVPSTAAPVHWPLVLLLVLTQCAAGLLVIAWVAARWQPVSRLCAVGGLVALGLGAAASISHLGRPAKAWRAFLGWRRSWLSREILVLHATLAAALTALWAPAVQGTAGALGLLLVYASGRVYTEVGRPFWSARRVFTGFYATAIVAGLASGAALAAWAGNEGVARGLATGVLLTAAPIGALRVSERRRALANAAHPIHRNVRLIHTRLARGMRTANGCWVASLAVALMAVETTGIVSAWVAAGLAATVVAYEILERALFFSGGMGRSMPGGIPA